MPTFKNVILGWKQGKETMKKEFQCYMETEEEKMKGRDLKIIRA